MLYFTPTQRAFINEFRPGHEETFDDLVSIVLVDTPTESYFTYEAAYSVFARWLVTEHGLTEKIALRKVEYFFKPDQSEPEPVATAEDASWKLRLIKGYIHQYEDGLITLHEMANSIIPKAFDITEQCKDQGADGLPPNEILP